MCRRHLDPGHHDGGQDDKGIQVQQLHEDHTLF